jgi:hypothetical protein
MSMTRMTLTPDEATRAIYIDFECLKTEPHPTPKLLGVLVEDELSQYAVDDALAPACKTTKRCVSLSTAEVISNIVQRAEGENRPIVGWSYNEHDCRALRHIVITTAHQLAAWRAYERTRFCVHDGGRQVCFMAGSVSRRLQSLLARHNANTFAFVTAWNPGSKPLTRAENERRGRLLDADVAALGYRGLHGVGIGQDPAWEPEESLMILGISRRRAIKLGRKYGQLAIVFGRAGAPAELVSCAVP